MQSIGSGQHPDRSFRRKNIRYTSSNPRREIDSLSALGFASSNNDMSSKDL